jgi:hypothetical protein
MSEASPETPEETFALQLFKNEAAYLCAAPECVIRAIKSRRLSSTVGA